MAGRDLRMVAGGQGVVVVGSRSELRKGIRGLKGRHRHRKNPSAASCARVGHSRRRGVAREGGGGKNEPVEHNQWHVGNFHENVDPTTWKQVPRCRENC